MTQTVADQDISTLSLVKQLDIKAAPATVFDAILAEMGPGSEMPDGTPFPMIVEPWPGGRWFRDLGEGRGHWWATVQVIKPPTLLEVCGPLFMSYPAVSHVQYRVEATPAGSRLTLTHRAMGQISAEHRAGVVTGWDHGLGRIRKIAEHRP
jgi:hypothetical protein